MSPRIVGKAFYNGEVENELRRIGRIDYKFKKDSSREECMTIIEELRRQKIYPHDADMCTSECKKRGVWKCLYSCYRQSVSKLYLHVGCGHLWVTDGIWKVVFPHCMFQVVVCCGYIIYILS